MVQIRYTRNLFLRGMSVVYLFAFTSFYIQIPGKFSYRFITFSFIMCIGLVGAENICYVF